MNEQDQSMGVDRKNAIPGERRNTLLWSMRQHPLLYVMVIPGLVFFIMFRIVPSFGSIIA